SFGRPNTDEYHSRLLSTNKASTFVTRNVYTRGYLTGIKNNATGANLYNLVTENARGQVTRANLGNGFVHTSSYYPNGYVNQMRTYKGGTNAMYMHYASWDHLKGQLKDRRNKAFGNYRETFTYDSMNRLTRIAGSQNKVHSYNAGGQIKSNNKIGNYAYNSKFQVSSIALNGAGNTYYSNYGNRDLTYNADRKPTYVNVHSKGKINFTYAPNMERSHAYYGGTHSNINNRRFHKHYSTIMPAEILEDKTEGTTKFTFFLAGDEYESSIVHIKKIQGNSTQINEVHYLHRDYLGSILGITNSSGQVLEKRQFGAWGSIDAVAGHGGVMNHTSIIDRGFTGHEHFFAEQLIHMNGRMYDPVIGQFLSPDNFVQDLENTQTFNRYAYAANNPLIYSDPNGEFFFLIPFVAGALTAVGIGATAATFIAAAVIGGATSVLVNGIGNVLNGQPFFSGAGNAFALGAISGVLTFGIGEIGSSLGLAGTTVAHGVVGGFISELSGGDFIAGFASAAIGHSIAFVSGNLSAHYTRAWRSVVQVASGAISGGIASKLAGGSFIMGFKQGFITSLLNDVAHNKMMSDILEENYPGEQNR
ncbi:MAG: RHS repeat-associated core domain-containing protein, partial [Bacteroidota bacterium]